MDMNPIIVILLLAGSLFLFKWRRANAIAGSAPPGKGELRQRNSNPARQRKSAPKNPFRAVVIAPGENTCAAARALNDKRFFCAKAPRLPLSDCDQVNCNCTYEMKKDRRAFGDRRAISALSSQIYTNTGKPEKRKRHGKRSEDW